MRVMDSLISYLRQITFRKDERLAGLYEAMRELAYRIWENCWARRDLFVDGSPLGRIVPGILRELRVHLRSMLCSQHLIQVYVAVCLPWVDTGLNDEQSGFVRAPKRRIA